MRLWLTLLLIMLPGAPAWAQGGRVVEPGPDRRPGEGEGPFPRLIIRGATVMTGPGPRRRARSRHGRREQPHREVRSVGYPKVAVREAARPTGATRELDASGMYVLPGFVDVHGHIGGAAQGTPAEYVYKLWLAHGVTTVRDPGAMNGVDWTLGERGRSAANRIAAPRIFVYVAPGAGWGGGPVNTAEAARSYVRWAAQKGADGPKVISRGAPVFDPEMMAALLDEEEARLGATTHLRRWASRA